MSMVLGSMVIVLSFRTASLWRTGLFSFRNAALFWFWLISIMHVVRESDEEFYCRFSESWSSWGFAGSWILLSVEQPDCFSYCTCACTALFLLLDSIFGLWFTPFSRAWYIKSLFAFAVLLDDCLIGRFTKQPTEEHLPKILIAFFHLTALCLSFGLGPIRQVGWLPLAGLAFTLWLLWNIIHEWGNHTYSGRSMFLTLPCVRETISRPRKMKKASKVPEKIDYPACLAFFTFLPDSLARHAVASDKRFWMRQLPHYRLQLRLGDIRV